MKSLLFSIFLLCTISATANLYKEVNPRLFLTPADIQRAKQQIISDNVAKASYDNLMTNILPLQSRRWQRDFPQKNGRYTMEELFSIAAASKISPTFDVEVAAYALNATDELAEQIRVKMLLEIGTRKALGSWRELGIHEGERLKRFMQSYDLMVETGVFSTEEKQTIKLEILKSARFLELWSLSNNNDLMNLRTNFCFNIKYYPACMIGVVAMYYPEVAEARRWFEISQHDMEYFLFTENFIDGAYGEGSLHYFHPSIDAVIHYILASKNIGFGDYTKHSSLSVFIKKALYWRMNLTAPDGRKVCAGDGHRLPTGTDIFEKAASLFNDGQFKWISQTILERVNNSLLEAPLDILSYNVSIKAEQPTTLMANYPFSGYAIFRSGWEKEDNYFVMKYGASFAGQRGNQREPVIAGHAHEDCMEIEMHYKGIPLFVDGGYRGKYGDYDTYGGFWKATIAHSTVGLGNTYGYDRLDGKYEEHQKEHGKEFRYEVEQKMIGSNNFRLLGLGDAGALTLTSAKAETYTDVEHQRTSIWFRNSSIAIIFDEMFSKNLQNYEWYLNPIGSFIKKDGVLCFGDETAKLDVVPVGDKLPYVSIVSNKSSNVPPYYYPFLAKNQEETAKKGWRWWNYCLMVQSQKAKNTNFLNVLIPYKGNSPYLTTNLGDNGKSIKGNDQEILVSKGNNSDKTVETNGSLGIVSLQKEQLSTYCVNNGSTLKYKNELLFESKLAKYENEYNLSSTVIAVVSIVDKKASITIKPAPWNNSLVLFQPADLNYNMNYSVKVSFKIDKKPSKMVISKSSQVLPKLTDSETDNQIALSDVLTDKKNYEVIRSALGLIKPEFQYNETTNMVTLTLTDGFNQLVWE